MIAKGSAIRRRCDGIEAMGRSRRKGRKGTEVKGKGGVRRELSWDGWMGDGRGM